MRETHLKNLEIFSKMIGDSNVNMILKIKEIISIFKQESLLVKKDQNSSIENYAKSIDNIKSIKPNISE